MVRVTQPVSGKARVQILAYVTSTDYNPNHHIVLDKLSSSLNLSFPGVILKVKLDGKAMHNVKHDRTII